MNPSSSAPDSTVRTLLCPGVWLDSGLAIWLEEHRALVVADLHWGYAASHRNRGNLLPEWGNAEVGTRLLQLIALYHPQRLIWLGDSLHTLDGRPMAEAFIHNLPSAVTLEIVRGNHDRAWSLAVHDVIRIGHYVLHHGDSSVSIAPEEIEITGHWHPAFTWTDGAGLRLKLPALIQGNGVGRHRWILPAFSPWAEGTNWDHKLRAGEIAWVISPKKIFPVRR